MKKLNIDESDIWWRLTDYSGPYQTGEWVKMLDTRWVYYHDIT
jgi:hypothetical protein